MEMIMEIKKVKTNDKHNYPKEIRCRVSRNNSFDKKTNKQKKTVFHHKEDILTHGPSYSGVLPAYSHSGLSQGTCQSN